MNRGTDIVTFDVPVHPAAELFPLMTGAAFDDLVEDVRKNGQRERIVFTPDDRLLDGRNRYLACHRLGIEPTARVVHNEPWAYAISMNLQRRQLTDAQRAMVGGKLAARGHGSNRYQTQSGSVESSHDDSTSAPPTQPQAARLLNVSKTSIERAHRIVDAGVPGLVEAVDAGRLKVATAIRIIEITDPGQRAEIVQKINSGESSRTVVPPAAKQTRRSEVSCIGPGIAAMIPHNKGASRDKYRYIQRDAVVSIRDLLNAMDVLIRDTEGLHPGIDASDAAELANDLAKARKHLIPLINLLKGRAAP